MRASRIEWVNSLSPLRLFGNTLPSPLVGEGQGGGLFYVAFREFRRGYLQNQDRQS